MSTVRLVVSTKYKIPVVESLDTRKSINEKPLRKGCLPVFHWSLCGLWVWFVLG
jgi:hypothetical protein